MHTWLLAVLFHFFIQQGLSFPYYQCIGTCIVVTNEVDGSAGF